MTSESRKATLRVAQEKSRNGIHAKLDRLLELLETLVKAEIKKD